MEELKISEQMSPLIYDDREASKIIHQQEDQITQRLLQMSAGYEDVNDSITIINYSNSYMNKPLEIKVVKEDHKWQVDFKYTYSGNLPID